MRAVVGQAQVLHGDAIEQLRTLADESVQCVVTSPPYFGLRDYAVSEQIGLESTPAEYLARVVDVFRELRRVLRADGTLWLNMGDSYAGSREHAGKHAPNVSALSANQVVAAQRRESGTGSIPIGSGLKPKDLMGMPWRLAFALQADGWYLRQDIIWAKPNPMPESVTDRCTKAHEYVFLLSKSERYYYDAAAISEAASENTNERKSQWKTPDGWDTTKGGGGHGSFHKEGREKGRKLAEVGVGTKNNASFDDAMAVMPERRNRRSVWTITSEPYPEAHFATFPTELPRICILAGSKIGDTILDPFAGSGTTLQVALELSRAAIGIELNAEYVALANRRLNSTTLGLPLEIAA